MKKSQLKKLVLQQVYKQKQYSTSTRKDIKSNFDACIRQALDNYFTKYYYNDDSIKIIKSLSKQINTFVNSVMDKLQDKQDL